MTAKDVERVSPLGNHLAKLELEASLTSSDKGSLTEWQEKKLAAILEAGDVDSINTLAIATGMSMSKELVGRTFEIRDFALAESAEGYRANSTLKKFVIVSAVDTATGEELVIDGGGDTFVAQLIAMREKFGFPFIGTLLSRTTGSGYELLYWRMSLPNDR